MRWPFLRFRRIFVALVTATSFFATWLLAAPVPAAAVADPAAQEQELLRLVNAERARAGAPPLAIQADLVGASRLHSQVMGGQDRIFHDIEGKRAVAPLGWSRLGENVGMGQEIGALHAAFMASPTHAANVLEPEFDWVGIGVAHGDDGMIFVAVAFMARPAPPPLPKLVR